MTLNMLSVYCHWHNTKTAYSTAKNHRWALGAVDLSSLFLQQFVGYLYKAELM